MLTFSFPALCVEWLLSSDWINTVLSFPAVEWSLNQLQALEKVSLPLAGLDVPTLSTPAFPPT